MIQIPAGWTLEHLPEAIALTHPAGDRAAQIHYRERAGKPRRVGTLAREIVAGWSSLSVQSFGAIERFLTAEGEFAALLGVECVEAGRIVHLDLGFVFTDDFFTSLTGTCRDLALRAEVGFIVRELVRQDNLALGIRRRRFEYQSPEGWQPFRRSLATEWLPPDYPNHNTTLIVYPTNPITVMGSLTFGSAHTYLEDLGCDVIDVSGIEKGTNKSGLGFEVQEVVFRRPNLPPRTTRIAVLTDAHYQYCLELRMVVTLDPHGDRQTLAQVVDSVVPFGPVQTTGVQHWIE